MEPVNQLSQANYLLSEGQILECPTAGVSPVCEKLPIPKETAQSIYVEEGELFTLFEGTRPVLAHFEKKSRTWREFDFDIITRCDFKTGHCDIYERDPVSLVFDHNHVIVELNDGSKERARLSRGRMFFEPHSRPIEGNNIEDILHQIASLDNAPNMFLMMRLPKTWGPALLNNRWEKLQAREWLAQQLEQTENPFERTNIQEAIDRLDQTTEDNKVVFKPHEGMRDNRYCDNTSCEPVLDEINYNENAHAYTMRFLNFIPDEIKLTEEQWKYITQPVEAKSASPDDEREALKEAARRWEIVVGSQTGGTQDMGGWLGNLMGVIPSFTPLVGAEMGQTNCNYEYFNMRELLLKLWAGGYLQHHEMPEAYGEGLASIGYGTIHQAVRLQEKESGQWYVIDSWPMGTGHPPLILPEDEWNIVSASSWDIFPTGESLSQTAPLNRFLTGAFGLGLSGYYAKGQIGLRLGALSVVMPSSQLVAMMQSRQGPLMLEGLRQLPFHFYEELPSGRINTFRVLQNGATVVPPNPLIDARNTHFFPREGMGREVRVHTWIPNQEKPIVQKEPLIRIVRSTATIRNPLMWSASKYFATPRGALNFGAMLLFASQIISSGYVKSPNGIPEPDDAGKLDGGTLFALLSSAGYFSAEGALAVRYGTTPLVYEIPLAGPPFALGAGVAGAISNEIARQSEIETFQKNGLGHWGIEMGGGIAAVHAAKRMIGKEVWNATAQSMNRFALNTIGRAGWAAETALLRGLSAASLEGVAACGAGTVAASAVLVAGAGIAGYGIGHLINETIMEPLIAPYVMDPYLVPLYSKYILPFQNSLEAALA